MESAWENCCEGESDRPADQSETGAVRERRSPTKSSQDGVRGEAATQPRDGCAAGMRKGRGAGRTPTEVFRLYEPASEEQSSTPQPTHVAEWRLSLRETIGRARLNSFGLTSGRLFGERGSILCSRSRIRGRESSRFLGTKRWKSQKLRQLSPEQPSEWKTSEGVAGQLSAHHSLRLCCHFAGSGPGLSFATGPRFNIRQSPAIVHSATLLATSSSVCLKQLIYAVIASGQVSASTPEAFCECEAHRKLQHSRQARRGQRPFPSP